MLANGVLAASANAVEEMFKRRVCGAASVASALHPVTLR